MNAADTLDTPRQTGARPVTSCGVYTITLKAGEGVARTLKALSPNGEFFQPMIDGRGRSVVFWGRETKESGLNIWRTDLSSNMPVRLTDIRAVSGHPFWNSDGERIVFFSTRGLTRDTRWSMGTQFAVDRSPRNIWVMNRDGSDLRRLTRGRFVDERPCISPDGKHVVFVSNRSGGGYLSLWSVFVETGELTPVTTGDCLAYRPIFSPDGRRLAFFTGGTEVSTHKLAIMSWPDGEVSFPLPAGFFKWIHGPFWLQGGSTILVHGIRKSGGKAGLYTVDIEDGQVREIVVPGFSEYAHGSMTRDGSVLAFDSRGRN